MYSQQHTFRASVAPTASHSSSGQTNSVVRRIILAIILVCIVISIYSMIFYLILHPEVPVIQLTVLSVSNFTISNSKISASCEVKFMVKNPNRRISLSFEQFDIFVSYRKNDLARTRIQPFTLTKMNVTDFSVELRMNSSGVLNERIVGEVVEDWSRIRVVSLDVRMMVWAKFSVGEWMKKVRSMVVFCDNLNVGFQSSNVKEGKLMSGTSINCPVSLV